MMKLTRNKILNGLSIISGVIVLCNDFIFHKTPEIISFGDELGTVLSNLSLSYISSYIFYLVVVVAKDKKDKQHVYAIVYQWTDELVSKGYQIYNIIITASGANHSDYKKEDITKEEFLKLCKRVNSNEVNKTLYHNFSRTTYNQFIYQYCVDDVKSYSQKIFNYMPFLDSKLVQLINNIHNSSFFFRVSLSHQVSWNIDFLADAESIYDFLQLIRELDNYNKTIVKGYLKK